MKTHLINKILLISFISIWTFSIQAQSHKLAFSFTGGYVQDGFGGMATLDYKVNQYDHIQFNILSNFTNLELEDIEIPVNLYGLNAGFYFDLLRNNKRTFALSVGGGGTIAYETINEGKKELGKAKRLLIENQVVYGVYVGLDIDVFIIPTISINIKANEAYHINSNIGAFSPYAGLGIKLILI